MARLDGELVARGIARSRERAKEMIKNGCVTVNGKAAKKPSQEVSAEDILESAEKETYVGRGLLKLEKAAEVFGLDLAGKTSLDIGASTGGFTEYMLVRGAEKVFSVDVGHGQLAESLRLDSRVVNMENTDIRSVSPEDIGGRAEFICGDVSFISLKKILPKVYELLREDGSAVMLIKPQFEAGKSGIGKKGVVKDRKVHVKVLEDIHDFAELIGFSAENYTYSPIKGGSGNIEYLVLLKKSGDKGKKFDFKGLVDRAFEEMRQEEKS